MNGGKFHRFRVTLGVDWSPGTLKAIAVAAVMAAGALWKFWDHIASLLATAPVAAFIAVLALFSANYANSAGDSLPFDASRHSLSRGYANVSEVLPCAT